MCFRIEQNSYAIVPVCEKGTLGSSPYGMLETENFSSGGEGLFAY